MCPAKRGFYGRVIAPRLLNTACGIAPITAQRQKVVPQARGVVLEVGIGTGLNMPHYDPGKITRVIGVDPDADITALAGARVKDADFDVEVITDTGEALPLEDDLADTAVLTYTLCSIPDVAAALQEIPPRAQTLRPHLVCRAWPLPALPCGALAGPAEPGMACHSRGLQHKPQYGKTFDRCGLCN